MMQNEKTMAILITADIIAGEINGMCVAKDLSELNAMHRHAQRNLDILADMIYEARFTADWREA